ncbi:MAG: Rho termination factor N-terminal domain-containing protein [Kaiparowitsia implicata GSE-PSE-MK54-09C]|jgi:hypothetical protein|nr:Rho termination factor N-terminal domain-containing protein [Kaiparowitsia implicata GSE-PSE-MK54-09C]
MLNPSEMLNLFDRSLSGEGLTPEQRERIRLRFIHAYAQAMLQNSQALQAMASTADLATLTIRELKQRAQAHGITRYSLMSKAQLIEAIHATTTH